MLRTLAIFISSLFFLLLCAACQQQDKTVENREGLVTATEAYQQSFGEPPQGKRGRAYARVGYLPLKDGSEMVRPLPVYLFSDGYHVLKILQRLASKELLLPGDSELYKPFPEDLVIAAQPPMNGLQRISLHSQKDWSEEGQKTAGIAFSETALQFPDIDRVILTLNDVPLSSMPAQGYMHNPQQIAGPGSPRLVLIAAAWEGGEDLPSELMVEFDRPVTIQKIGIYDPEGNKVEGDYYTSIFEMAVIVHPDEPGRLHEGMDFVVEWDVVDTLGRSGQGVSTLSLHRYDH